MKKETVNKQCNSPNCAKDGSKFRCPECSKFAINTYYCSQECYKSSWKEHKKFHSLFKSGERMFAAMRQEERDKFEREMRGGNFSVGQYYVGSKNELGQKHGKGTLYWMNGSIYEGDFAHDKQNGHGKHNLFNGDVYEGEYKNDQMHGHGLYRWADGGEYNGTFVNDKMHGQGLRKWPLGDYHEGEYRLGLRNGRGIMFYQDGSVFDGVFVNDIRKEGELTFANGDTYTGSFENGQPHGEGKLVTTGGQTYTGRFAFGKFAPSKSSSSSKSGQGLCFSDLTVGKTHTGNFLAGTIVSKPFKMNGIHLTLRDSEGADMTVSVYNYPGYQGSFSYTKDSNSLLNPDACGLEKGRRIRINDPFCKVAMDGQIIIRVNDFSTIEFE